MTDPFTAIYNKLWEALEADTAFAALVKVGNRVKFAGVDEPKVKTEVAPADLPEVSILPIGGGSFKWHASSSHVDFTQNYSIGIATNDLRLDAKVLPVKFHILRVLAGLQDRFGLEWVTRVRISDPSENLTDDQQKRGTAGWSGIVLVSVDAHIERDKFIAGVF